MFQTLLVRCQAAVPARRKFRFRNKLVSLDSTVIDLCAALFDWAKFRRTKGAVKLHLLLDHDGYTRSSRRASGRMFGWRAPCASSRAPSWSWIEGTWTTNEFHELTEDGVFFVTRLKDDAVYHVVQPARVPERSTVVRDEVIHLAGQGAVAKCPQLLRLVEVDDPATGRGCCF